METFWRRVAVPAGHPGLGPHAGATAAAGSQLFLFCSNRKSLKGSEAEQMLNSQMSLEEKIKRAHHVVWNNGDRGILLEQAKRLVAFWQGQSWTRT